MQMLRRSRLLGIPAILVGVVALLLPGVANAQTASLVADADGSLGTDTDGPVDPGEIIGVSGHCPGGSAGETALSVFAGEGFDGRLLGLVQIAENGDFSGAIPIPEDPPGGSWEILVTCPAGEETLTHPLRMANFHSFAEAIDWLLAEGIARGYADGSFRGTAPVSRQAMAAFFYRLAHDGADAPACTERPFPDVSVSNQFCGEIAWLKEQRITRGYDDGTYRPTASMSRGSMAPFIYRLFNADSEPFITCELTSPFRDVGHDPFCPEVFWMYREGITDGWEYSDEPSDRFRDVYYHPDRPVSRTAMAAFLYRAVVEEGMTIA